MSSDESQFLPVLNGGIQTVIPMTALASPQIIYLDFDGEQTVYHGEILTVDEVTVEDSGLSEERIAKITAALNDQFANQNVLFVLERPVVGEYSTIYIGKTSSFELYGSFAGLAETVDSGNKNKSDNAFVILDSTADDVLIIETIAHEAGHLLGTIDHGGDGLGKYKSTFLYNQTFTGELPNQSFFQLTLQHLDSQNSGTTAPVYYFYDKADGVVIGAGGELYVNSGTWATNIQLNSGGEILVRNGGTVTNLHCNGGAITNSDNLWLDNTPVFLNNSRTYGGGIYNVGNITIGTSAVFSENYAGRSGGGIYNTSQGSMGIGDHALFSENINAIYNGRANMSIGNSAVFIRNHDRFGGGAICNISGSMNIGDHAEFIGNYGKDGDGAIYNNAGGSMSIGDHAVFSGNSARYDGAVGNCSAVLSIGESAVFSGNSVSSECGGLGNFCGYVSFGGYATFIENVAGSRGGAVSNCAGSMSFGSSAVFSGNSAKYGAAVYNGGIMTLSNGARFSGNIADKTGAIYNAKNMEIGASAVFSGNSATYAGAAFNESSMTIGNSAVFSNNTAGSDGGALYNSYGIMIIGDSAVFSGNSAGSSGGAIYVLHGGITSIGNHVVFSGNSAGGAGGAVCKISSSGTIGNDAVFSNNIAGSNGGALYNSGTMTIGDNAVFSGNSATSGGAIFNTSFGNIVFGSNTIFSGNSALVGGAIYNAGSLTLSDCRFATESDTVYTTGTLTLTGRNIFAGTITIAGSKKLSNQGSLVLDVSSRTSEQEAILNNWSLVSNSKKSSIAVLVSDTMSSGTYRLIGNATSFDTEISVYAEDDSLLGTISVGGENLVSGSNKYNLVQNNGLLSLTVENMPGRLVNLQGNANGVSWSGPEGKHEYIVEYSIDQFTYVLPVHVSGMALDSLNLPQNTYQWRVQAEDVSDDWTEGADIKASAAAGTPEVWQSDADTNTDLFFAQSWGQWGDGYAAHHLGNGAWQGTGEYANLKGKNQITDVFIGSEDANVLVLTDSENGDALFVEDIYTELPGTLSAQQARIAQIDEIRAGAGDDIVDMTSQRFEYIGDGVTIHGGLGDDTIWANKGNNTLFGDAGNDRLVGASDNDILVGGIGNDSMHGGGGDDIFCFCDDWGQDTVEQLATGKVTLWFNDIERSKLTLSAGESGYALFSDDNGNDITVKSVLFSDISEAWNAGDNAFGDKLSLKFGDDGSEQYDNLLADGAFEEFTSERIFENRDKGLLA